MALTSFDLYRIGDGSGAGLENVRIGIDVQVFTFQGNDWIYPTTQGGASVRSAIYKLRKDTSRWWRLPAGSSYPDTLILRNDHGSHWLWEALQPMFLTDYVAILAAISKNFI